MANGTDLEVARILALQQQLPMMMSSADYCERLESDSEEEDRGSHRHVLPRHLSNSGSNNSAMATLLRQQHELATFRQLQQRAGNIKLGIYIFSLIY